MELIVPILGMFKLSQSGMVSTSSSMMELVSLIFALVGFDYVANAAVPSSIRHLVYGLTQLLSTRPRWHLPAQDMLRSPSILDALTGSVYSHSTPDLYERSVLPWPVNMVSAFLEKSIRLDDGTPMIIVSLASTDQPLNAPRFHA